MRGYVGLFKGTWEEAFFLVPRYFVISYYIELLVLNGS